MNVLRRVRCRIGKPYALPDFGGEDDLAAFLIEDCDTGRFRSGIELQLQVRRRRIDDLSLENDRERVTTEDGGPALLPKAIGRDAASSGLTASWSCLKRLLSYSKRNLSISA